MLGWKWVDMCSYIHCRSKKQLMWLFGHSANILPTSTPLLQPFSLWDIHFVFFVLAHLSNTCLALMFFWHIKKFATLCFESLFVSHKPTIPSSFLLLFSSLACNYWPPSLPVSHSGLCCVKVWANVCVNMFEILMACSILCRWLCCSHYGYRSSKWTEAGRMWGHLYVIQHRTGTQWE